MAYTPQPLYDPTVISSLRDPQGNNSAATVPQIDPQLHWLEPEIAPFISLMANKLNKYKPISDYKKTWFKKYPYPHRVTSLGAVAAGVNVITLRVGDGAKLALDYYLMNLRTEENVRVSVAPTTDNVTCIRGLGDHGPFDINDGDAWLILGNTREDGADIGALRSTGQRTDFNLAEIQRNPFGLTGRMLKTERWIGSDLEESQREAWHEHAKSLERKAFWGLRDQRLGTLGNGQNTMGGLRQFIKRNVWDLDGKNITKTSFDDFCVEAGKYGRGGYLFGTAVKGIFCGRAMAQMFSDWAEEKVRYAPSDNHVGMVIDVIKNASGTWNIFKTGTFDIVPELANQAFIVDMTEVGTADFNGRGTALLSDRQGNGLDGRQLEYLTDNTLIVPMEEAHGRIINVSL